MTRYLTPIILLLLSVTTLAQSWSYWPRSRWQPVPPIPPIQRSLDMKTPILLDPATIDVDAIRRGNWHALADAITVMREAYNLQALGLARRIGSWQDVSFNASDFFAGGGGGPVWTVEAADVLVFRYIVIDNFMIVNFEAETTVISTAAAATLHITVPGGYKVPSGSRSFAAFQMTLPGFTHHIGAVWGQGEIITLQRYEESATVSFPTGTVSNLAFTLMLEIAPPAGS